VVGWRRVTGAVRAAGGRMFLQLQHGGRIGYPDNSGLTPVAPSPVALPDTIFTPRGPRASVVPREMTIDEIRSTAADFAAAARNARRKEVSIRLAHTTQRRRDTSTAELPAGGNFSIRGHPPRYVHGTTSRRVVVAPRPLRSSADSRGFNPAAIR
jgi:hypothetical protein